MGLFSIFKKSSTLYYPGCVTFFKFPESFELYSKIFYRLGIDFKVIDKKLCCGLPAFEAGYDVEARKLARRNFEIFKEEQITSIITNSPCCYKMFSVDYSKIIPDWDIETKNLWRIILAKLEAKPSLIKYNGTGVITYHDSCYLGRHSGIYDEPRKILELIGYTIKEMPEFLEESVCCGSCGGITRTNPELANKIATQRIMQAKRFGIKRIVVCSFEEYELLKKNSEGLGVEIFEMSDILGLALGLKKPEEKEDPRVNEIIEESNEDDENEIGSDSLKSENSRVAEDSETENNEEEDEEKRA
ncbi:MAG: (Fe-S)-binding protein [Candidatus Pacearchaeota archaeon]|jgi:Fe-S oxidoreductase